MKDIVIFGIGIEGQKILKTFDRTKVKCIVDNNSALWGTFYDEIPIVSIDEIEEEKENIEVLISSTKYESEIAIQLSKLGFRYINYAQYYIREKFKKNSDKRIILLNTHMNINLGDHAITIAELEIFERFLPQYEIIEIPAPICEKEMQYIKTFVKSEDRMVISGGGYMGSLWMKWGEDAIRDVIRAFPDNRIIIMPQTMFFEDNEYGKKEMENTIDIYGKHKNLIVCMREKKSYDLAKKIFPQEVDVRLIPDVVLALNKSERYCERSGCIFCFREDKERILPEQVESKVIDYFKKKNIEILNMSMYADEPLNEIEREKVLMQKIGKVQRAQLVITDRLHCMLLCVITGTPCIAFDNLSGKISGTYEWIRNLEYIKMPATVEGALLDIEKFREKKKYVYNNTGLINKYKEIIELIEKG